MSSEITPVNQNQITTDHSFLDKLENYEDYVSFYIQLEEAQAGVAWLKADTLIHMLEKLGDNSTTQLAQDLKLPSSTVTNYIRVARAFPPEKREPLMTFSAHLEASFADSYDQKSGEFSGEERGKWIAKAAEENMATRQIKRLVNESKEEDTEKYKIKNIARQIMQWVGALRDSALKDDEEAKDKLFKIQELSNS